ncbi:MAG: hypothetical protein CR982_02850 [Candidatus Cloacimonadota bacterium]|nr:MAG: hypothetical protein CR982_02850 [Candidatus Cloacimonadota bacterium]PIE79208.1 MAG: hypothetical protein CSA15_04045 [Candidatus Delongbacteria bacterium]
MEEKRFKIEKDDRKIGQEHISQNASTVYEAIMVIAKRARDVENFQKRELDKEIEALADKTDVTFTEDLKADLPKYDKSERVAIHEFLDNHLEYKYEDITKLKK